ncbi:hypothetical protein SEA_ZION_67 [Corynebacterium phage Zion]|uniref:Uncharacterized protein n=3 Tax=Corynebacterium virus Zion TaxID=2560397 RepID=A0A2H4P8W4_9CAUD|nr:hypothetical protein FDJ12_gp77 [Corynebacterium phage Zion]ATW58674.1 hypothetical protein SEA_POTATOCHIP_67 [Corynebacterium phage PotatoChip]ATW58835.1 hypothetical protein SEA_ZION_67 [Corynebacterium phage Zion]AYR03335.1 hypothetical protein PETEYPAB_66 [Corynebacterium phage PeteyPab]
MIWEAHTAGYLDTVVTVSGQRPVKMMMIKLYNPEDKERLTLFAEAGKYKDDNYIPYTDIEVLQSVERELNRCGFEVVVDNRYAPVLASLTPEESTIATRQFEVIEKELT